MPPLPLAREFSARGLPPRADLHFVLRPRELNFNVTRQAVGFRYLLWEEEWQSRVEGVDFGLSCGRRCCCRSRRGDGIGCGERAVICEGGLVQAQVQVGLELEIRVEIEVTDQGEA